MPWQRMVADVGGELTPDGLPAYREVVVTVPRQNGKTTLVLSWEVQRSRGWERLGPQRISYSAQSGADARKKLLQDQAPILKPHLKTLGIRRIYQASGAEGIAWHNGSRLVLLNNTVASGHGPSVDLGVKDELFADYDDRRDQALIPAMATKAHGQILACSTMGTEESAPWNALVDRGRLAVELGQRSDIAYFEWSAGDDDDPDDPDTWYRCMPALGHTITEPVVAHARSTMRDGEFRRAFLNRKTKAENRVISTEDWLAVCDPNATPTGGLCFALDINPERSAGAIVAASVGAIEVVPRTPNDGFGAAGIAWMLPRAVELDARNQRPLWMVDASGPAASLIGPMEAAGLRVHPVKSGELVAACAQFYDAIVDRRVRLRQNAALDDAAAGAAKRVIGDSWAWTRKNASADISSLVAATLALWGTTQTTEAEPSPAFFSFADLTD